MNKKNIQIAIIIVAFASSGFVLYRGLSQNNSAQPVSTAIPSASLEPETVLPYGDSLDFNRVLKRNNLQFGLLKLPKLSPSTEIGIPEQNLITIPQLVPQK